MKILISHSSKDNDLFNILSSYLENEGHDVLNASDFNIVEYWKENANVQNDDILVAIFTENFLNSSWAQAELSSVFLGVKGIQTILIVVGDVLIPDYYTQFVLYKIQSKGKFADSLIDIMKFIISVQDGVDTTKRVNNPQNINSEKINNIKTALANNQLTLVCGAGVSINSFIPSWDQLLIRILEDVISRSPSQNIKKEDVKTLISKMPQSNLIIGKYMRLMLKEDFDRVVQHSLYSEYNEYVSTRSNNDYVETNLLKAIAALARPNRTGRHLDSIITFNFDDLIERTLSKYNVEYSSIWKEGQPTKADALPIYHVHGFLPNKEEFENPYLVFSEEEYHSQFIDPYSWQNLIQLNTFSKNVCLFIGLSLSDPNLRRLLDISERKNHSKRHYIIAKRLTDKSDDIISKLFENDALSLGINVIWCKDYEELPNILDKISK